MAVHDYGHDLPPVTRTINVLIGENADDIARVWTSGITIFVQRRR